MMTNHGKIFEKLHSIYEKHRKKYNRNLDSNQMCLMWSTSNPPDIIEGTRPFIDIEKAFNIDIDDDECFELYDMTLEEASKKIAGIVNRQSDE